MPSRSKSRSILVSVCLGLFSLFLIYELSLAVRYGLADLYATPAKRYLRTLQEKNSTLEKENWEAARAGLIKATKLVSHNPFYLSDLGRLHLVRLSDPLLDNRALDQHSATASDYYQQATRLRPTWPWDWGNLALVEYKRGLPDIEKFNQALVFVARFGPWEEQLQLLLIQLGSGAWDVLASQAKQVIVSTVSRSLSKQPEDTISLLDTYGAWGKICHAVLASKVDESGQKRIVDSEQIEKQCQDRSGGAANMSRTSG